MEIRNIVVPLDGSSLAENALPLAVAIARSADACVRLVGVVPGAGFIGPMDVPDGISEALHDARARLTEYVERIEARVRAEAWVRTTGQVRVDTPVDGILKTIVETDADLVVLTSHGHGGFKRAFLGSVADAILRRTPVPALIVKSTGEKELDLTEDPRFDSVVVPLDGSELAEKALDAGYEMARLLKAPPVLLRIVTPVEGAPPMVPAIEGVGQPAPADAQSYVDEVAGRAVEGLHPRAIVLHDDSAASAIVGFCAGSLAVIASHGRGGVKRLLLGSVADKVIRMSDHPVLVVRPEAKSAEIEEIWRANASPMAGAATGTALVHC